MESTTILELNQGQIQTQNGTANRHIINNSNGDYEIIISPAITVNPGDEIECENAFLDTRTISSDKILIREDMEIKTRHIYYKRNFIPDGMAYVNQFIATDNGLYPLCTYIPVSEANIVWDTLTCRITDVYTVYGNIWGISTETGPTEKQPLTLSFSYINLTGATGTFNLTFPEEGIFCNPADPTTLIYTFKNLNIQAQFITPTLNNDPENVSRFYNVRTDDFVFTQIPIIAGSCVPVEVETTFNVLAGNYAPADLAKSITDKMNTMPTDIFLASTTKVPVPVPPPNPLKVKPSTYLGLYQTYDKTVTIEGDVYPTGLFADSAENNQLMFPINRTADPARNGKANLLLGTNQVSLTYNDDINRFQWDYLHMPIYNVSGQLIIAYGQFLVNSAAGFVYDPSRCGYAGSFSGIAFTSLEPIEFWRDDMGFDMSSILVNINHSGPVQTLSGGYSDVGEPTATAYTVKLPTFDIIEGVHTTGSRISIDAAVSKTNPIGAQFQQPFVELDSALSGATTPPQNSIITATDFIPLIANFNVGSRNSNRGYYIADIDCIFKGHTTGSTRSHNIKYIINRYYSVNSFTSSASDGIIYTHYGSPMLLSSIRVRITEPDGSIVTDIGINNSIIMRLTQRIEEDIVKSDPKK